MKHKILVTGGAGYIGSHTCKALAHSGFQPVVFDNLSTGHAWAVKWGPLVEGDLCDGARIKMAIAEHQPFAVIHFAASAYVAESVANPRKYFRNNVQSTLNLLDAMIDGGMRRLVFSSTCATYGIPKEVPIPENHVQRPINPYGESKLFIERMIHWYGKAYGLTSVILRYFNAAGADSDGELGESHNPETHLIPLAIQAATRTGPELSIFGADYATPDGTCIRDYIHVSDLADAHVAALGTLSEPSRKMTSLNVNLGSGVGYSVLDVLSCVREISGRPVPHKFCAPRPGDPPVLVARSTSAAAIGWEPGRSSLTEIVRSACAWHSRCCRTPVPAASSLSF